MENSPADFQQQLNALRSAYALQLPGKTRQIQAAWHALDKTGPAAESLDMLLRLLHNLAGSGASYGFPAVSEAAREIDACLRPVVESGAFTSEVELRVSALMARLAVAAACQDSHPAVVAAATDDARQLGLKILVADDDPDSASLVGTLLRMEGHTVIAAHDGREAVALFQSEAPDLVLMDVVMPVMDGYEAAHSIKQQCGTRFVPLIFLTGLDDDKALARCVESGGDDFLVKPYNRIILNAKIAAMQRIRAMHRDLEHYREKTEAEIATSRHVFDSITNRNPVLLGVRYWLSSVGHFCGDLLLYEMTPSGRLHVLLGDFTGHGLGAAIGALPTADIFYDMTNRGCSIADIAAELNRKLHAVLPWGSFCAACLIGIDPAARSLEIWNGGLPQVMLLDAGGQVVARMASTRLALGIVGDDKFDREPESIAMDGIPHTLLLFSDGLNEARNAQGAMLGMDGVERAVVSAGSASAVLEAVKGRALEFLAGREPDDDILLVAVETGF